MPSDRRPSDTDLTDAVHRLRTAMTPRDHPRPDGATLAAALDGLPATLPDAGLGSDRALDRVAALALDGTTQLHHPGFFAHMDPPTPWVTWVTAMWTAATNQNLLHDDTAPAARPVEHRIVAWLAPFFGMDGGHLVPGSSVANLTALWAARERTGVTSVIASDRSHLSVAKAASILGLTYRTVPADATHRLTTLPDDLSSTALVLTAGTTQTGAIDDLAMASDAAWTHVDAAWAGPLVLSPTHAHRLAGVERADSVAVSGHKWLFQPKESALVLFADTTAAHDALSFGSGYLAAPNIGLLGSHGAAAVPLLATLLAFGRDGMVARIDAAMALADRLHTRVGDEPLLESWGPNASGVVAWRPHGTWDLRQLRDSLEGAFVSVTDFDGESWLRCVAANPDADPDLVVDAVLSAMRTMS